MEPVLAELHNAGWWSVRVSDQHRPKDEHPLPSHRVRCVEIYASFWFLEHENLGNIKLLCQIDPIVYPVLDVLKYCM